MGTEDKGCQECREPPLRVEDTVCPDMSTLSQAPWITYLCSSWLCGPWLRFTERGN
jgi:hypothetical protein